MSRIFVCGGCWVEMMFLQPLLLVVLLTIPVILVLHVLRERRPRMAVPSLQHWLGLPRSPVGVQVRRLRLRLLVVLHVLIAGFLGVALGRPQVFGVRREGDRQMIVVVDMSMSMGALDGGGTRFAQAQAQVRAVVRGLRGRDRATLIGAGAQAAVLASGTIDDVAMLLVVLDGLRPMGGVADLDGALMLAEAVQLPGFANRVVVVSDGAQPLLQPRRLAVPVDWRVVGGDQPNRAIVAFSARAVGVHQHVFARVVNNGALPFDTTLALYVDERLVDTRRVALSADGSAELTWVLPDVPMRVRAALVGGDGLPLDDQAFLALAPARSVRVVLVTRHADPLRRALVAVPGVSVVVSDPQGYAGEVSAPPVADLTIFDGFLPGRWPPGAVLVIAPPPDQPQVLEVQRFPVFPEGSGWLRQGPLLADLSFDGVRFGPVQGLTVPVWAETQLALGDVALIVRGRFDGHEVAIWTFDLTQGNLAARLAFPVLVARTVRDLTPAALPAGVQVGQVVQVRADVRATGITVSGPDGVSTQQEVGLPVSFVGQVPGFYHVEEQGAGEVLFVGDVGVSAGGVGEADLRRRGGVPMVGAEGPSDVVQLRVSDVWPWLGVGALALLMLEWGYVHR